MWIIYIVIWLIFSWVLAYFLTRSLTKYYTHNLRLKSTRNISIPNANNPEEKQLALELLLKNLGSETIKIIEVGIFYKTTNTHSPFTKLINKSNTTPIILKQKDSAKFTQLYTDFPIDIEDIQRSYLKVYAKDDKDHYYYETL